MNDRTPPDKGSKRMPQHVHFYDCNCDVRTKYCDEYHQRTVTLDEIRAQAAEAATAEFFRFADASNAVTWTGALGLKERWTHRNDPAYQQMLRDRGEAVS